MVKLAQHIEQIKNNKVIMRALSYFPLDNMIVLGKYIEEYWIQHPEALCEGETEICTVQELLECLALEKK